LYSLGFLGVCWQPTGPQMVYKRPILGNVGGSIYREVATAKHTKPWTVVHLTSSRAAGAVFVVTVIAPVA
jgi:hypothetical protein